MNPKDSPMDYKQLDDFLQTYLPDEYYEDIRAKIIPAFKTLLDEHKTELYWRSQFNFLQRDYYELEQKSESLKLELQKKKEEINALNLSEQKCITSMKSRKGLTLNW